MFIAHWNGIEQREKIMKANRDRHLPVAVLHPQHEFEFVLEKTGITTPSQFTGPIFLFVSCAP